MRSTSIPRVLCLGGSSFDVATIARFLYIYLGPAFKLNIIAKSVSYEQLLRYSRIPPRVFRSLISTVYDLKELIREINAKRIFAVSYDGMSIENMTISRDELLWVMIPFEPQYEAVLREIASRGFEITKLKALGVKPLRYEAIAVLYALLSELQIMRPLSVDIENIEQYPSLVLERVRINDLIYIGRKILESIEHFDNNEVLSCSACVAVLNKFLKPYGLKAELHKCIIEIDSIGKIVQEIDIAIYALSKSSINFVCSSRISYDGNEIRFSIPIDRECKDRIDLRVDVRRRCVDIYGRCVEVSMISSGIDYDLFWHIITDIYSDRGESQRVK